MMMKSQQHLFVLGSLQFLVVITVWMALFSLAFAQDEEKNRARQLFNQGVQLYESGEFIDALAAFQEAYRIRPHPSVRINMANCYDRLGRTKEALFHFEHFLKESDANAPQRAEVKKAITRLESMVGHLTLQVVPDGASVLIDDHEQRTTPILEPIPLTKGTHKITVRHPSYQPEERRVQITGGESLSMSITLENPVRAPVVSGSSTSAGSKQVSKSSQKSIADAEQPDGDSSDDIEKPTAKEEKEGSTPLTEQEPGELDDKGTGLSTPVIVVGCVTIGFVIVTAVTGGLALSADSDYDSYYATFEDETLPVEERKNAQDQANDAASRASDLAMASDIFLVGSIIGAGVTLTLFLLQDDNDSSRDTSAVVPLIGADRAGLSLVGIF